MGDRLFACSLLLSAFAFAQDTGRITGTVVDPNGALVVGATVQARDSSGAVVKASSSAQGQYTLSAPAGTYDVSVAVPGVKGYMRKGVTVAAGKTTALEIRLEDTTQLSTLGEDRFAVAADLGKHKPPAARRRGLPMGNPISRACGGRPPPSIPASPNFFPGLRI